MDYFSDFKSDFLKNILGATEKNYKSRSRQLIIDFANNPEFMPIISYNPFKFGFLFKQSLSSRNSVNLPTDFRKLL